jgi:hypothetical protein
MESRMSLDGAGGGEWGEQDDPGGSWSPGKAGKESAVGEAEPAGRYVFPFMVGAAGWGLH